MVKQQLKKIALIGNPNSGKSSLFNQLTGLQQKISNFPGVTVEKKRGKTKLNKEQEITVVDFPGTYSLYPTSQDERVVLNVLANTNDENHPDLVVYVADVNFLEKHLLLLTQIKDLNIPIVFALNMMDQVEAKGIEVNIPKLSTLLGIPVIPISGRNGYNLEALKDAISQNLESTENTSKKTKGFYRLSKQEQKITQGICRDLEIKNTYQALLIAHHAGQLPFLNTEDETTVQKICSEEDFKDLPAQIEETMQRFNTFTPILEKVIKKPVLTESSLTDKLDAILIHKIFGPFIFFLLMFLIFQAIFEWANYPMDWIEAGFINLTSFLKNTLPTGWATDLLTDGVIAGLGGILIFIPQIAILFFLIALLEESGYMSRAVFMFDKIMQKFGLNGRSIVALVSGGACAIPAIMSTRTISNWKERLITILVTPFISCSARIPVYTVLIGFVVPPVVVLGIFNLQGLLFMGLYLLGIIAALGSAYIFKKILKTQESSFLLLEMPEYRLPIWKNVWISVKDKVTTFVVEAGKVIMIISVLLWVLASYGPGDEMAQVELATQSQALEQQLNEVETADLIASKKMEVSYAGHLGKFIEPAIEPLGYDWKIGIALITSFAAREVFIGTMATLYSIGSSDSEVTLRNRMAAEINPDTGLAVYSITTSLSLLIFYVFAMQCMSTLVVVKKETGGWKWAVIQFIFMGVLAYLGSWLVFQIGSVL